VLLIVVVFIGAYERKLPGQSRCRRITASHDRWRISMVFACSDATDKEGDLIELSVSIEGLCGLTWHAWKRLVEEVESLGYAGLFLSDHFTLPETSAIDSLEMIVALTYLADHTQRLHFGPMVAPFSFRDPVMLARQAAALDDLSDGRMILGVGAGWMEYEHNMFGYNLGDMATRLARFGEGLEVITSLLQRNKPVSYEGRFYQLREAILYPRPQRPGGPPILVGGKGPLRTLPLVARYANIWNATRITPDQFRALSDTLDALVRMAGREPKAIKRTLMTPVICGHDTTELERRVQPFRKLFPELADMSLDAVLDDLRSTFINMLVGTPEDIIGAIRAYADVGVEELIIQWCGVEDLEGLQVLAKQVLPHVVA
jgi:alkanesulfonate monooxygenase SsuD/methylene tetrahydromethanopterin reductase-like flavin-dependent oxidoreductase (luciferase family)